MPTAFLKRIAAAFRHPGGVVVAQTEPMAGAVQQVISQAAPPKKPVGFPVDVSPDVFTDRRQRGLPRA
jgi:hypothetical protein